MSSSYSRRGSSDRGGRSGGSKKKGKFLSLGSLTATKGSKKDRNLVDLCADLKESGLTLTMKVYPPKDVEEVTLKRDDLITFYFKPYDDAPSYVLGNASLVLPEDEGGDDDREERSERSERSSRSSRRGGSSRRRDRDDSDDKDDADDSDSDSKE